jgi:hypothetical protein
MRPPPLSLLDGLSGVLQEARLAPQAEVRRNAHRLEEIVRLHHERALSDVELLFEIESLRTRMRGLLRERAVKHGGRLDRLTLGVLDAVREKLLARIAGDAPGRG